MPPIGESWYEIHADSLHAPSILAITNVDKALFYADSSHQNTVDSRNIEFKRNRIGNTKHFVLDIQKNTLSKFYAKITVFKTSNNQYIQCIDAATFQDSVHKSYYEDRYSNGFIIIMLGAFILQVIYNLILLISRKKPEYLFVLFFCFEYTRLNVLIFNNQLGWKSGFLTFPHDIFISTSLILIYYYLFFYFFYPKIGKIAIYSVGYFLLNIIVYSSLLLFGKIVLAEQFWGISLLVSYIISLCYMYLLWRLDDPVKYFFIIGTVSVIIGAIISRIFALYNIQSNYDHYTIRMLTYLFDFIMFNMALNYRYNLEKKQQQKEIEQQRNHIAADLHDDLGSGLTTIRLLGERAQIGIENTEKRSQIQKITNQASELIEKMSTIIWAMNTQNDTVGNLMYYLRSYAHNFLQDIHDINLHFPLPDVHPSVSKAIIIGDTRREIFLTFKEALHNIIKHANTKEVSIAISLKNNNLDIKINDYGRGLNGSNTIGNGLKNMELRMKQMGGKFDIKNNDTEGCLVIISLPLNFS